MKVDSRKKKQTQRPHVALRWQILPFNTSFLSLLSGMHSSLCSARTSSTTCEATRADFALAHFALVACAVRLPWNQVGTDALKPWEKGSKEHHDVPTS